MRSVTATPTVCKKQVRKHSFMILIYTCFAYLPNAHAIAPNNEDVIAASPPDVKIGTTNFCKKISHIRFPMVLNHPETLYGLFTLISLKLSYFYEYNPFIAVLAMLHFHFCVAPYSRSTYYNAFSCYPINHTFHFLYSIS